MLSVPNEEFDRCVKVPRMSCRPRKLMRRLIVARLYSEREKQLQF